MSILEVIANHSGNFTKTQQKIAFYLIQDPHQISFLNLRDLAEAIDVTEVTIINFCKAIGLDSYSQLKSEFQKLLLSEIQVPKEIQRSLSEITSEENAYDNTIQVQRDNIMQLSRLNSVERLTQVANVLLSGERVFLCGMGVSKIVISYIHHRLQMIGIPSIIMDVEELQDISLKLTDVTRKDCFILVSLPYYSHPVRALAEYLHDVEIPFIGISDREDITMMQLTPHKLLTGGQAVVFHNFISNTIALVELLLVMVSYGQKEKLTAFLSRLEDTRKRITEYL